MTLFSLCFSKIIPLYLNILLGYLAGKFLDAHRETIARLMLYIINPIVIFNGVLLTKMDAGVLALPFLVFLISSLICLCFFRLSRSMWQDSSRSLVAFSAGTGNTGYFGLPLALMLFDQQGEGLYIMALLGITFFENSVGYYIFARETMPAKECVRKLLTLPALYAFILGLLLNVFKLPIPELFGEFMQHIKGTYSVLGMMIIGLGLATLTSFKIDFKFIGLTFFAKFVVWPVVVLLLIQADLYFFNLMNPSIYNALILLAIVPLGSNTVMMAALMRSYPEKAATAVLISILVALVYVPVMAEYFITK